MQQSTRNEQGIISLMVILSIGLLALGTVLTATSGVMSEFNKNRNASFGDQAFYASESSVREASANFIGKYASDPSFADMLKAYSGVYSESYTTPQALKNNSNFAQLYDVEISGSWPVYEVKGPVDSQRNRNHRVTANTITVFPEGLAFNFAIFANDLLSIDGNSTIEGDVFANQDVTLKGNAKIEGDASTAGEFITVGSNTPDEYITGTIAENATPIPVPQISTDDYRSLAQNLGKYFTDINDAKTYLNNPDPDMVVFVDDTADLKLTGVSLTGTLVTMGNLELAGNSNFQNNSSTLPTIVTDKNLSLSGTPTLKGIIYVKGVTTFGNGTYTIDGTLIGAGGVSVTGNTTVIFDPNAIANWPNINGLNTTSTENPRVILWREE